jgi:hypothetical protein
MKHVYLCGPIGGIPITESVARFYMAEQEIRRRANADTVSVCTSNPMRFCAPGLGRHEARRTCVGEMVRCGGIALLQGWQQSRGATLELKLAQELRIPVVHVEPPIDRASLADLFAAAPEAARYYNARLEQFRKEGAEEPLAEGRALVELANRYLDPHGFEYINIEGED